MTGRCDNCGKAMREHGRLAECYPERASHRPRDAGGMADLTLRLQAAKHETVCRECRVTWRSWWQRLRGDPRGFTPQVDRS